MLCIKNGTIVSKMPDLIKEHDVIIFFQVVSLFTFGAKDFGAPIGGPWLLQKLLWFFYFAAPLTTFVALADLFLLAKPLFINYIIHLNPYYLVLGYGRVGKSAVESINKKYKKSYCLILDKDAPASQNNFSIVFKHSIFLNKNISDIYPIHNILTSRCKGIYILTDNELLNLKLYDQLLNQISTNNFKQTEIYVRIRSSELFDVNVLNKKTASQRSHFLNIHTATPELFFDKDYYESLSQAELINNNNSDAITKHFIKNYEQFSNWLKEEYDCVLFLGFGTFSAYLYNHLKYLNVLNSSCKVIIIDQHARRNWDNFNLINKHNEPILYDTSVQHISESNTSLQKDFGNKVLCITATNDENINIKCAAYINRNYGKSSNINILVRTKQHDTITNEMADYIFTKNRWVIIPTYSWAKLYFDKQKGIHT